ncbi:uncharacterized protein LOC105381158 isoform X5 [Plutella xylostella]|uniref:uncharacterized protein LOC105381158 isoform X5 n=1 Tax=Plutella xylostella TaxID=51655 RepID=UPI002032D549|nr:uncharacterized protein LOC105381158 isoform X5 [Plutella xylostella]
MERVDDDGGQWEDWTPMKFTYCFVPTCKNTTTKGKPHKRFFKVPFTNRKAWCQAVGRSDVPTSSVSVCEDHLQLEDDLVNYLKWKYVQCRPKLKTRVPAKLLALNFPQASASKQPDNEHCLLQNNIEHSHIQAKFLTQNDTLCEPDMNNLGVQASLGSQRVVKEDTTLPDTSPRVLPVPVSQKAEAAGSLVYNAKVPATSAGLRCAECGGAVAGRVFACVQCAGAGLCAACGGGAGGRHRRHAVLRLPSRRIYNKVRDLFESLQKEFAKLGLDDASDDESLNSDDDEVPIGNDDDDEEESKDWEQSLTVPVTSSPSRKRKRKTKSYASTAPKDKYSNIMDDTDIDEPLVLVKQPPLDDNPDPLSEVKIEPDEPPEETAAGVITEDSVVKSGIISEVPTTVQTNKGIKDSKKDSVKTKRRSGLNKVTMDSHLTTFKKAEIIVLYKQNIAISEIARRLMISRRTVQLWVHRYRDSGHVDSSRRGRKPTATYTDASPRHREIVAAHSADPFCSTRSTATAHNISLQTVRVHLRAAGMRCRKVAKKIV